MALPTSEWSHIASDSKGWFLKRFCHSYSWTNAPLLFQLHYMLLCCLHCVIVLNVIKTYRERLCSLINRVRAKPYPRSVSSVIKEHRILTPAWWKKYIPEDGEFIQGLTLESGCVVMLQLATDVRGVVSGCPCKPSLTGVVYVWNFLCSCCKNFLSWISDI